MGTYVENGNSCIGCSLLEEFPGECNGCHNLKSQIELIELLSSRDEEIKKYKSLINTMEASHHHKNTTIEKQQAEIKKLRDQLSRLESHMGLPDKLLKDGD